ncbi:C13 family peptidase [Sphingobium nicotianae]|uniref:Peptidase C13 n=1 Tax=Sphingobium nicotianae TaxID=2782607 RepID=A0A9X1DA51_9SPHN|nr:C13 family peptidase [Sphingobium nicotianae]MBT2186202.1 hypothetical protein [Sphingobium nicotianae]
MDTSLSALRRNAAMIAILFLGAAARADLPSPRNATSCSLAQPLPPRNVIDLWGVQDRLVRDCLAQIPPRATDHPNVYAVAIAPLGTQALFSREARTALQKLAAKYGGTARGGVLLSNGAADLMQVPLATPENMAQIFDDIGSRMAGSPDDVLIVYLTSHGRPDAAVATALPGNVPLIALSADTLGATLDRAHIRRRVIILSACFAGSWIPRLTSDDTIVIAAARPDRTSFGCDDRRELTYFGEAFLTGPLARGASLAESFDGARKMVTQWETAQKLLPSEPQMFVGRNMQSFWQGPLAKAAPRKIAARR